MSIKITWNNPESVDSITIYKSTSKIDLGALPDPYVTIAGTATQFIDSGVSRNTVYHYVIAKTIGTDTIYSPSQAHGYYPNTGPGPQELIRGDWESGYFGPVSQGELYTWVELRSLVQGEFGLTITPAVGVGPAATEWHKFAYKGKVIFTVHRHIGYNTSNPIHETLYNAGCLHGIEGTGSVKPSQSPTFVNQFATFDDKGHTFLFRAMRLTTDTPGEVVDFTNLGTFDGVTGVYNNPRLTEGEYFQTVGRLFGYPRVKSPQSPLGCEVLSTATGDAGYFTCSAITKTDGTEYGTLRNLYTRFEDIMTTSRQSNPVYNLLFPVLELIA